MNFIELEEEHLGNLDLSVIHIKNENYMFGFYDSYWYIEGQAIDITNDPTFSGERLDAPQPAIDAVLVVDAAEPPRSRPGGGAVSASPTALYTDEKRSDPPPPPAGTTKRPRAKKSKTQVA